MGSLTTRKSDGLKGYTRLSRVSGDEWGLEATASSLPTEGGFLHRICYAIRLNKMKHPIQFIYAGFGVA